MIDFPIARLQPQPGDVYAALGLKSGNLPSARSAALLQRALELFRACAEPLGVSDPVSPDEFAGIFTGLGRNAPDTPLQGIFPRAKRLHLFAFTLGARIGDTGAAASVISLIETTLGQASAVSNGTS